MYRTESRGPVSSEILVSNAVDTTAYKIPKTDCANTNGIRITNSHLKRLLVNNQIRYMKNDWTVEATTEVTATETNKGG